MGIVFCLIVTALGAVTLIIPDSLLPFYFGCILIPLAHPQVRELFASGEHIVASRRFFFEVMTAAAGMVAFAVAITNWNLPVRDLSPKLALPIALFFASVPFTQRNFLNTRRLGCLFIYLMAAAARWNPQAKPLIFVPLGIELVFLFGALAKHFRELFKDAIDQ